ncbi:MAG: diol dehydratase small subunit [Peptostreptococcaceae bacterium]
MNQELLIKQIVEEVLKGMTPSSVVAEETKCCGTVSSAQYPLGENIPDQISSQSGMKLSEITLDKLISGEVNAKDIRISKETLEMQAQVAESVGRGAFAQNLRKAAELIAVPDERILEIYNALRPYRSTKVELIAIADELENVYGCTINSAYVREAADVYETRGRLRED